MAELVHWNINIFPIWIPWIFVGLAGIGALTDFFWGKIYNFLTFPLLLIGLICAGVFGHFYNAILSVLLVALVFIPLFFFGVFGGGDVKLIMALASILNTRQTLHFIWACILVGGIGAAVLLIRQKRVRVFFKQVGKFFQSLLIPGLLIDWPRLSKKSKAPFGIAIFAGFLWTIL